MSRKNRVRKLKVSSWVNAYKYLEYSDLIRVLFNPDDEVTEKELDTAIKKHLEREV